MDMFNRLKNTVTSAISGNPLNKEFEIGIHRASAGPGLLWKVQDGIKKTTKQVLRELYSERYHLILYRQVQILKLFCYRVWVECLLGRFDIYYTFSTSMISALFV